MEDGPVQDQNMSPISKTTYTSLSIKTRRVIKLKEDLQ